MERTSKSSRVSEVSGQAPLRGLFCFAGWRFASKRDEGSPGPTGRGLRHSRFPRVSPWAIFDPPSGRVKRSQRSWPSCYPRSQNRDLGHPSFCGGWRAQRATADPSTPLGAQSLPMARPTSVRMTLSGWVEFVLAHPDCLPMQTIRMGQRSVGGEAQSLAGVDDVPDGA
jgi:hypothetical protein